MSFWNRNELIIVGLIFLQPHFPEHTAIRNLIFRPMETGFTLVLCDPYPVTHQDYIPNGIPTERIPVGQKQVLWLPRFIV